MLHYEQSNVVRAKRLRKAMTPWEKKLWYGFLRGRRPRWQRQKPILRYIVDFYCAKARLVIEVDGSGHYRLLQRRYDAKRTRALEKLGLRVLRFPNNDVRDHFEAVCSNIVREERERLLARYGTEIVEA